MSRSVAPLFRPFVLSKLSLANRVVMAPMTRQMSPGGIPGPEVAAYYRRRAESGTGLIITEGVAPAAIGLGYARTPAAETAEQMAAWKKIVHAVHEKGGHIFMQLMHVGRIAHPANRYKNESPIAPSAVRAAGQMWTDAQGMQDLPEPRALETS